MTSKPDPKPGPSTRSVHGPGSDGAEPRPSSIPIHPASVYRFDSLASTDAALASPGSEFVYLRYGHPTGVRVEERLSALEGAANTALFASGLAALSACVMSACNPGDRVVACLSMYGGTAGLLRQLEEKQAISVLFVTLEELYNPDMYAGTTMVLVESPANPLTRLVDFERFMAALPEEKPLTLIDATFATPLAQDSIGAGFDLVVHSATKYLGGHDDLLAGVVSGSREALHPVREWRRKHGATCDPQTAWLVDRGLKTLGLRWERQCANALAVARFLEGRAGVSRVMHPGLASHPDHDLAKRQMRSFGAITAFDVDGLEAARRVYDRLRWIQRAPTLGGVESTVMHPATASHRDLEPEEREALGIYEGTLRLSLGIEDEADLIADLEQALS